MKKQGFTLLEVLVVMVIIGLVTATLIQAFIQIGRLDARFGVQLADLPRRAMRLEWFRSIIQGLQVDYADGLSVFHGDAHTMSGITSEPLDSTMAARAQFKLDIVPVGRSGRIMLRYTSQEQPKIVAEWSGRAGEFAYLDHKGERHDRWPPPSGVWPQLPEAVELTLEGQTGPLVIFAIPRGPRKPLPRQLEPGVFTG